MKLTITDKNNAIGNSAVNLNTEPDKNGTFLSRGSKGGTEMTYMRLMQDGDKNLLKEVNIICSRVRDDSIDPKKKNILWCTDTWDDPESEHLKNAKSRERFAKLVFVSNYQQASYNMGLGVPYADGVVIQNAIDPIAINDNDKSLDTIRMIYHTTPHRGLELLVPVYERLYELHGDSIHLDVFSSFNIYGWPQRDIPYEPLFKKIINHPGMTYHGYQPNVVVREYLAKSHLFVYPSIWPETSCIAAIEALSACNTVICSNLAALPETTGPFSITYGFDEDPTRHANRCLNLAHSAINYYKTPEATEEINQKLSVQKMVIDNMYSWEYRINQWNSFLRAVVEA